MGPLMTTLSELPVTWLRTVTRNVPAVMFVASGAYGLYIEGPRIAAGKWRHKALAHR